MPYNFDKGSRDASKIEMTSKHQTLPNCPRPNDSGKLLPIYVISNNPLLSTRHHLETFGRIAGETCRYLFMLLLMSISCFVTA
jgi:hypothetical protein